MQSWTTSWAPSRAQDFLADEGPAFVPAGLLGIPTRSLPMYRTRIFCSSDLGENEALEHFPIIEERWAAVEEAEEIARIADSLLDDDTGAPRTDTPVHP